jgi:DNA-binding winged helix-turn-helix (wHTH) protein
VADSVSGSVHLTIAFGPFVLIPSQQLLLRTGQPVQIGSRAFEILTCLVERAGEIVSKEDLIARVWPKVFVQEGNLKVHVATLRQALGYGQGGNRYIVNLPGRGYRFVAAISRQTAPSQTDLSVVAAPGSQRWRSPICWPPRIGMAVDSSIWRP